MLDERGERMEAEGQHVGYFSRDRTDSLRGQLDARGWHVDLAEIVRDGRGVATAGLLDFLLGRQTGRPAR
ncbi:hypothetical protein WL46_02715 [Burkholderia ubonensis]|nr:hypothetical protein WL46_02715 [Burkholderia ubonensis]